ncbi:MAG: HAD family phosphatase [Prevotella sp.]|nr:HAD family phosphatase [Prevotella sp.]
MLKAALFDLDGVVFDTEPLYTKFWEQLGKNLHLPYDNFASVIKGMTLVEIFERYFPGEELQQRIRHCVEQYEREMSYAYVPGSERVLRELRQRGVRLAIVTSSDTEKMRNVYRQHPELSDCFDLILTAEDFEKGKPAPDCYLKALEVFGLEGSECVVFEDSFNGIKAGKNAGIKVVGVATTNPKDLLLPVCDAVIDNFEHVSIDKLLSF